MPPRKRRSFTAEYKVEAAHRVIDSGRTIAEVARELGLNESLLGEWVKVERRRIAAAEVHGEKPLDTAERAELLRLRRQVGELEKDNAFLVKSLGVVQPPQVAHAEFTDGPDLVVSEFDSGVEYMHDER